MAPTKKASIAAEPTFPLKKKLRSNFKYSPQKKTTDKSNQVFVKEYLRTEIRGQCESDVFCYNGYR